MISIFEQHPPAPRAISSVGLSCLLHGAGFAVASYAILHAPRVHVQVITERYSVRHLELHTPDAQPTDAEGAKISYPDKEAGKGTLQDALSAALQDAGQEDATEKVAREDTPPLPETAPGKGSNQTLLQPQFHTHATLAQSAPIPSVVIWTPELASKKDIVAPTPDAQTASTAKPALDPPNEELNLADRAVSATHAQPKIATPPPGTTSPIVHDAPALVQMAPATMSLSARPPTPTVVLSLSDLKLNDGSVTLPPVNEVQMQLNAREMAPATPSHGGSTAKAGAGTAIAAASTPGTSAVPARENAQKPQPEGQSTGAGLANTAHIVLPKDGKFGVVVVGSSLSDEYPETLQIWNDRVAYTAYLHVGLAKNWILQYAQVRSADAASNGEEGRLEAPWPYDIFRPNLISSDLNADALMIHGIVNQDGRFEKLAIAFPAEFDHASFVLHALQQWQFRPARQNGKPTAVEVLLIIPDELE